MYHQFILYLFSYGLSAVDAAVSEPEEAGGATEGSQVPVPDAGEHAVEVDTEQGEGECSKCTFLKNEQNGSPVADC